MKIEYSHRRTAGVFSRQSTRRKRRAKLAAKQSSYRYWKPETYRNYNVPRYNAPRRPRQPSQLRVVWQS